MSGAQRVYEFEQDYRFRRGGRLSAVRLVYETWGELNHAADNAILIFTGLSPGAHAASSEADPEPGWWEPMIGPGKPLDSERFFIICINSLGSCWGSTGPASIDPASGQPYRLSFPELTIEDIALSSQRVLEHLGIERLAVVVGPSMGGMTTLAYLRHFSHGARHALIISSAPVAEPFATAIRSLQRETIVSDRNWRDGNYDDTVWPETGMRIARKIGMISYRSPLEWRGRFDRQPQDHYPNAVFGMNFPIESYLETHARRFVRSFDPACYVYLSRAMDWFDATADSKGFADAYAGLQLESACVMGVATDILFPAHQQKALAESLQGVGVKTRFQLLESVQGHDAFLVDYDRFRPAVAGYLAEV